jgi:hypothetical protein
MSENLSPDIMTRAHGHIPDETVAEWRRIVVDPTTPPAWREMIIRTATDALTRIGKTFDVPAPKKE